MSASATQGIHVHVINFRIIIIIVLLSMINDIVPTYHAVTNKQS